KTRSADSASRLEQLHQVAGRVLDEHLRSAGSGHGLLRPERHSGCLKTLDLLREIVDLDMDAIPATWRLLRAVRECALSRAAFTAEQQSHAIPHDGRKRRRGVMLQRESEMCRIEANGLGNIIDHVTDSDSGHHILLSDADSRLVPNARP